MATENTLSSLKIESVPASKPNQLRQVRLNGVKYNHRAVEQALAYAANATEEQQFNITVQPVVDEPQ